MEHRHNKIFTAATAIGASISILLIVAYIASAFGGMVDPAESAKLSVLGLCFPILLIAMLIMLLLWLLLRKWSMVALIATALIVTSSEILTFSPLNIGSCDASADKSFKVLTFNVMSFADNAGCATDTNRTISYILHSGADIVCLQEVGLTPSQSNNDSLLHRMSQVEAVYPYHYRNTDDVMLLSKFPFSITTDSRDIDGIVRARGWDIDVNGKFIRLITCHIESIGLTDTDKVLYQKLTRLDNMSTVNDIEEVRGTLVAKLTRAFRRRALQAKELRKLLDNAGENVILCGDFNDTPSSFAYRTIQGTDMHDAYADCAFGPDITYHSNRFFFRIDHILYRGGFSACNIERGKIDSSDHYPLLATFAWK